jgi:hypothetical protein
MVDLRYEGFHELLQLCQVENRVHETVTFVPWRSAQNDSCKNVVKTWVSSPNIHAKPWARIVRCAVNL